jgi:hypothetical protein
MKQLRILIIIVAIVFMVIRYYYVEFHGIKYDQSGVSFNLPSKWKLTTQDTINRGEFFGYSLRFEKANKEASSQIKILWINDSLNLDHWINSIKESFAKDTSALNKSGVSFGTLTSSEFNKYPCFSMTHKFDFDSKHLEGIMYWFYANHKTFNVFYQGLDVEKLRNQKAIDMLKETFQCK